MMSAHPDHPISFVSPRWPTLLAGLTLINPPCATKPAIMLWYAWRCHERAERKTAGRRIGQAPVVAENIIADKAGRRPRAIQWLWIMSANGTARSVPLGYGKMLLPSFQITIDGTKPSRAAWF
jgi:hypothetical protein